MIDGFARVTKRLAFLKPVFILVGITALGLTAAEIFYKVMPDEDDALLIPSIVLFLWSLIGWIALNTFPSVPAQPDRLPGFFARLRVYFARFFYYGLALVFVVLSLVALYMSYKLLGIWLR